MSAMDQRSLNISSRRRSHHEATKSSEVQLHSPIGFMHIGYKLLRVQQYDQVLRKECERVYNKIFLCDPDGTTFRNSELRTKYSDIHVGEFVRVANVVDAECAGDLGIGGTNHF